jgi:hypothetical protein
LGDTARTKGPIGRARRRLYPSKVPPTMGASDVAEGQLLCFRGDGRTVFSVVRVAHPTEADWRSHYEQQKKPRHAEIGSALDHMSLSMWSFEGQARDINEAVGRKLGDFVAAIELRPEEGIWFAETGPEGHHAVWGRPESLQRSCLAVHPV